VALNVVKGRAPIVLVAPHGGRRDSERRPWGSAPLKMNDLHTAALALDLAARLDASALVNPSADRNDVDLNRVTAAHDGAPAFLDALGDLLAEGLAAHPRLSLLTVHGWNVVQPAVDIGLGAHPEPAHAGRRRPVRDRTGLRDDDPPALRGGARGARDRRDAGAALSGPRAREPAAALHATLRRRRARRRPPARRLRRARGRAPARAVAAASPARALARRVRRRLRGGVRDATRRTDPCAWPPWLDDAAPPEPIALEFVAPGLAGLAAIDPHGGRLLLFPDDGRLVHFTGERVGRHAPIAWVRSA
jgi:hypothetical protein